jgi:lysozyme family protein
MGQLSMSGDLFPAAVAIVLEREGVFSNAAADPGGPTWFGIARAFYPDIPWPPTRDQAIAIYRAEYWLRCRCDQFPWPLALALFDGAVQHAPADSIRIMQAALKVPADEETDGCDRGGDAAAARSY